MPWDFSDQLTAKELMEARVSALEDIRQKFKAGQQNKGDEYKKYIEILDEKLILKESQRNYKNYWDKSSYRKKFADFLSFVGVICVCFLLGSVALSAGMKNRIEAGFIDKLFLAYGLFATWIPMRMYSDWTGGLLDEKSGSNSNLIIAALILVILAGLFMTFKNPTLKVGITTSAIALVCTVIGAIGALELGWFERLAQLIFSVESYNLFFIYIILFVSFAALIVYISDGEEKV